jgi:hypothetical protein
MTGPVDVIFICVFICVRCVFSVIKNNSEVSVREKNVFA